MLRVCGTLHCVIFLARHNTNASIPDMPIPPGSKVWAYGHMACGHMSIHHMPIPPGKILCSVQLGPHLGSCSSAASCARHIRPVVHCSFMQCRLLQRLSHKASSGGHDLLPIMLLQPAACMMTWVPVHSTLRALSSSWLCSCLLVKQAAMGYAVSC